MSANKTLNERPHRTRDIRELLPYLIFGGDDDLQKRVLDGIAAFPQHLPFQYEEEKNDPERVAELEKRMAVFAERGDLENWRVQKTRDGDGFLIWCDPPSTHTDSFKEESEDHTRLNEYFALSLWANETMEKGALCPKISLADAWQRVQAIDNEGAFAPTEDFHEQQRAAAVAGVAFVLARYGDDEAALSWAIAALHRAAIAPEMPRDFLTRSSVLSMHPKVFAVHGYAGLLARDREVADAQAALLAAVLHPLEHLASAVFISMAAYAFKYPTFCWVLMSMGVSRSIADYDHIPQHYSIVPNAMERATNDRLLRRARRALARNSVPKIPAIPMPWVKRPWFSLDRVKDWVARRRPMPVDRAPRRRAPRRRASPATSGYERNRSAFLWNVAEELVLKAPLAALLEHTEGESRLIALAEQLRDFTLMEVVPPFAESRRDYQGNTPFNWVYACAGWLGRVLAVISDGEAKKRLLTPILAADNETALLLLHTIMRHFMLRALAASADITPANLALWQCLSDWVLDNPEGAHPLNEHLDREYSDCVFHLLFCATADFSPLLCVIEPGWKHLPLFLPIVDKTIAKLGANTLVFSAVTTLLDRGGRGWLPDPALGWIETVVETRKSDVPFWEIHGENTIAVLKALIVNQGNLPEDLRQRVIRLADRLVDAGVRGAGFLQQELLRPAS